MLAKLGLPAATIDEWLDLDTVCDHGPQPVVTTESVTTETAGGTVRCHLHQLDAPLPWSIIDDEISHGAMSIEEQQKEQAPEHEGAVTGGVPSDPR